MITDVHAHLVPRALVDAAAGGRVPSVRAVPDGGAHRFVIGDAAPTRPVPARLVDVDERLAWMDAQGVDHQLVGPWLDVVGYELDGDDGLAWARLVNETLREAVEATDRLAPLGTLPLQEVDAARGMVEAGELDGFAGIMIGTRVGDRELDDPAFGGLWDALAASELAVFVHPGFYEDPRLESYGLINAVGRGQDTTVAGARLLFGGVPTRHPRTRFVLAHGGGALPFLLGRLRRNHDLHPDETADPAENFRALYFDSVVFDPALLRLLCDSAGSDRVLCGSDYPFPIGDPEPTAVVEQAGLTASEVDRVLSSNAQTVFPLLSKLAS